MMCCPPTCATPPTRVSCCPMAHISIYSHHTASAHSTYRRGSPVRATSRLTCRRPSRCNHPPRQSAWMARLPRYHPEEENEERTAMADVADVANRAARYTLGIDVGGTKIYAGVVNTATGEVIATARKRTHPERGADFFAQRLLVVAQDALD